MDYLNFHLLMAKHGEKHIFCMSPNSKKIILDFDRVGYTPELLLDEISDRFSGHPNYWESNYYRIWWTGDEINQFLDDCYYRDDYCRLVYICVYDGCFYCALNKEKINCEDAVLFNNLMWHVKSKHEDWEIIFRVVKEDEMAI